MHQEQEPGFAAFVGIDWSDKKHDICVYVAGQAKAERLVVEHRAEAIQAWAEGLRERFGGAPVAVSVELQEGPIVWALLEYNFIVMFPVKPTTVARYRSAFRPSGAQLRTVSASIARFDAEITRLSEGLPDYALFAELPGAGVTLAPRLLAAFGERRERFSDASAAQKCFGIAPVIERSGNKSWVHWRFGCSKFLRQTFVEWAGQTVPRCAWAKAYYEAHTARGGRHQAALRALAFKWIRILFRCWQDRVPYDESRYLAALGKRAATPS